MKAKLKSIALLALIFCVFKSSRSAETILLDGFSKSSSSRELEYENRLKSLLSPKRVEDHLRWLTSRPHRTGTEGARITADYILQRLKEWGISAEIVRYEAYLPAPVSVSVQLIAPIRRTLPTTEKQIPGDPFTKDVAKHPGWNAYSPSGEATGEVVYAAHGSSEAFDTLRSLGVDVRGKIVLMRYFGAGEGTKVKNAEDAGAAGVVLYSDPKEDGYHYGDVYPDGNWRPWDGIMRRSIIRLPYDGDPLSPGFASTPDAKRLKPQQLDLPKIPVLPISYRSAEQILRLMKGPVAPYEWQGDLPLTYKVGPGPAKLRIRTQMDNRDRPMLNVLGKIEGIDSPEEWIIVGNHHDAWIFGAGDPSSGTASLLELAHGLGDLMKEGFKPRRTLILAFWDAEEMLLGGSTEWVEEHAEELLEKGVACINMDSSVFNTDRPLSVSAHPVLHHLFREASKNIQDPRTKLSTFEKWRDLQNQYRNTPGVDGWGEFFDPSKTLTEPYIFESPSDDAAPFYYYLAIPASDMYYGADYGMYHSIYENFHWMKTVVDPTFEYHVVMSELQGIVSLRLANADLVPLDYAEEARYWRKSYNLLKETAETNNKKIANLAEALSLIDRWEAEANGLSNDVRTLLNSDKKVNFTEINRSMYMLPRNFYRKSGTAANLYDRNMFVGSSGILPGLNSSLEKGKDTEDESKIYLSALQSRVKNLQKIRQQIQIANGSKDSK
jgi:N-acetylated-alpha-linked acidic dipeptidase